MNSTEITTLLLIAQASISFLIALRAFNRYSRSGNDLLFILGMSMGIIAFVGVIGLSFLMGLAFLLITFGIAVTTPWYFEQARVLYLYVGDSMRTAGLVTLFVAFLAG